MSAKIEILKDGVWIKLELMDSGDIKYNARINKIGSTSNRQIGSTNTFSLPYTSSNIHALGINIYNQQTLAKALNRKYEANYYVDNVIIQSGYLLINNSRFGQINVNFIDKALDIVSKWGEITYKELLENESMPINADYQASISELRNYAMPTNALLTPLTNIGAREYNLCIFPNNLNALGDKFQINEDDVRVDDAFNPYQSRPVYNAMSLFDLACERFGFLADYDPSVDWNTIKNTYFISDGSNKSDEEDESEYSNVTYPVIPTYDYFSSFQGGFGFSPKYSQAMMLFAESNAYQPASWPNWVDSDYVVESPTVWVYKSPTYWKNKATVFKPNLVNGTGGEIRFHADYTYTGVRQDEHTKVIIYWNTSIPGGDVINQSYGDGTHSTGTPDEPFPAAIEMVAYGTGQYELDITIQKSIFNNIPANATTPIGITITRQFSTLTGHTLTLTNMTVTEISNTSESVTFDDYDQFENNPVDFTYAASRETLKSLLIGIMHKEGILMNINNDTNIIKFFTYAHYETQQENGEFVVWDDYYLKNSNPEWQTNYGNNYAKINRIGLIEPFKGNTFKFDLENQGELSRYKANGDDLNKKFKDVEDVDQIHNTLNAYTEYTSKGLGLIEIRNTLAGSLAQVRADKSTQGNFTGLPLMANVNYATVPDGVTEWYQLVDQAVRIKAQFLLPVNAMRDLDLSKPVYIGELGGYYIIEEISEYKKPELPVTAKLIKLISTINDNEPEISLSSVAYDAADVFEQDANLIINTINFNNYIPTDVTIKGDQYINNVATGFSFTTDLTDGNGGLPPYSNNTVTWTSQIPVGTQAGEYRITVTDNISSLESNEEIVNWTNAVGRTISFAVDNNETSEQHARLTWSYNNYIQDPAVSTFTYMLFDYDTNTYIGPTLTANWSTSDGSVVFAFPQSGYYVMRLETSTPNAVYDSRDDLSLFPEIGFWVE